jgi:hypothetical protein
VKKRKAPKRRSPIAASLAQKQHRQRVVANKKRREKHWRKTGVSDATINWMKKEGWL